MVAILTVDIQFLMIVGGEYIASVVVTVMIN